MFFIAQGKETAIFAVEICQMPLILNIESATEICSVCLADGDRILILEEETEPFKHSERLTILIQNCFEKTGISIHEIAAVALSEGPGSYTSLRVGASVAKGICYALDKPLMAIDTLHSLAFAARKQNTADFFCPMIDARRMDVYTALFDAFGEKVSETETKTITEESFSELFQDKKTMLFCGNGAPKSSEIIRHANACFLYLKCSAAHLIEPSFQKFLAGQFTDVAAFEPLYLKPPNITVAKQLL